MRFLRMAHAGENRALSRVTADANRTVRVPRPTEGSPLARQLPRVGSITVSRKVTVLAVGGALCLTATGTAAALGRAASPASPIAVADVLYVHSRPRAAPCRQPVAAGVTSQLVLRQAASARPSRTPRRSPHARRTARRGPGRGGTCGGRPGPRGPPARGRCAAKRAEAARPRSGGTQQAPPSGRALSSPLRRSAYLLARRSRSPRSCSPRTDGRASSPASIRCGSRKAAGTCTRRTRARARTGFRRRCPARRWRPPDPTGRRTRPLRSVGPRLHPGQLRLPVRRVGPRGGLRLVLARSSQFLSSAGPGWPADRDLRLPAPVLCFDFRSVVTISLPACRECAVPLAGRLRNRRDKKSVVDRAIDPLGRGGNDAARD